MDHDPSPQAAVAHVLRRTGFLAHPSQVAGWAERGPAALLEDRLNGEAVEAPDWKLSEDWEDYERAVAWMLDRFRDPNAGLHERMTWFWHDHFATSIDKVGDVAMMFDQHRTLRRHALGNFRELVHDMLVDPAMLIYLDGDGSEGESPNENLARELMELFTLGRGNYAEADVRAGARALSGWYVDDRGHSRFDADYAFRGAVTFLGRNGRLEAADVADAVCDHPACSRFIAAKVARSFTGVQPDEERLERWAADFGSSGLEIRPLVEAVLTDSSFLDGRLNRLRTPIEWVSAAMVATDTAGDDVGPWTFEQLGQVPWSPPNVAGWPEGDRWGGADQMLRRVDLATWFGSGEWELDAADPVGEVLDRCSLHEISDTTRSTLERVASRTASATWEQHSLLFSLALTSPEFALA